MQKFLSEPAETETDDGTRAEAAVSAALSEQAAGGGGGGGETGEGVFPGGGRQHTKGEKGSVTQERAEGYLKGYWRSHHPALDGEGVCHRGALDGQTLDGRSDRHPAGTHAAREEARWEEKAARAKGARAKGEQGEQAAAAGRAGPVAFGGLQRALADSDPATAGSCAGGTGTGATQSPPAGVTSHVAAPAASAPAGLPLSAGGRNVRVHLGFCASLQVKQVGGALTPSDTGCERFLGLRQACVCVCVCLYAREKRGPTV
jgi:hypothetical protein